MNEICLSCKKHTKCGRAKVETIGCGYYVPMTNEEHLKSCTTEQLAEFIIKAMLFYDNAGITVLEAIKNAVEDNEKLGKYFIENVVEWLKEIHK